MGRSELLACVQTAREKWRTRRQSHDGEIKVWKKVGCWQPQQGNVHTLWRDFQEPKASVDDMHVLGNAGDEAKMEESNKASDIQREEVFAK